MSVLLDGQRQQIFLDRYALKDSEGSPLETTPQEMWERVARAVASVERDETTRHNVYRDFLYALEDFKFVPGGRILSGAGTGTAVTYYNCFVIPSPEDSRGGILDNIKIMTEIMARGGGVGVNLSTLRPRGSYIKTVNGHSSGPINWAEIYSVMTGKVIQQGGTRRGALMIMLDDDHPDIMEFITAKAIDPLTNMPVALNHANISVGVSDDFMAAVEADADWPTQFPTKANVKIMQEELRRQNGFAPDADVVFDIPVRYGKVYKARELWHAICESAWRTAEPGLVFIDRYNTVSNTWYYENIRCVNPCAEQGLPPYGVCNLGAVNLSVFVDDNGVFDYESLRNVVEISTHFLDNIIDANFYFLDANAEAQLGTRRTGLGTMGLADALIKMKLRYGAPEADVAIERIYKTIRDAAYSASADIAAVKGAFPKFDRDKYIQGEFIKQLPEWLQEKIYANGVRNAVILTQAPTGTTSMLAGVSSGIEPVFAFKTQRVDRLGTHIMNHPLYQAWLDGRQSSDEAVPSYFVKANDLTPEDHIAVQALVQQYTDSSISKTVNGPNSHTVDDVKRLYGLAYDTGCKGITYYRDGSRNAVLTDAGSAPQASPAAPSATESSVVSHPIRERPDVVYGYTKRVVAPEAKLNVTVNSDDHGPFEVFINAGKAGSDVNAMAEGMARLMSYCLRLDGQTTPEERLAGMVEQLRGIRGSRTVGFGPKAVKSLPDGVGLALEDYAVVQSKAGPQSLAAVIAKDVVDDGVPVFSGDSCPECQQFSLVLEEGCKHCFNCGYSACG